MRREVTAVADGFTGRLAEVNVNAIGLSDGRHRSRQSAAHLFFEIRLQAFKRPDLPGGRILAWIEVEDEAAVHPCRQSDQRLWMIAPPREDAPLVGGSVFQALPGVRRLGFKRPGFPGAVRLRREIALTAGKHGPATTCELERRRTHGGRQVVGGHSLTFTRRRDVMLTAVTLPTPTKRDKRMDAWSPAYDKRKSPTMDAVLDGAMTNRAPDKWAYARRIASLLSDTGLTGPSQTLPITYGWMMGYPPGWLASALISAMAKGSLLPASLSRRSATPSSRKSLKPSAAQS